MHTEIKLLPTQYEALFPNHKENADYCTYQGGFGSGKTKAGLFFGYSKAKMWPGSRGLVCAKTHTLLKKTTRKDWDEFLNPKEIRSWNKVEDELVLTNGSEVWFCEGTPEKVRSTYFNWIHIEEGSLLSWENYREVAARLRRKKPSGANWPDYQRRLLITTNPQETPGWIDRRFGPGNSNPKKYRRLIAPTTENAFLEGEAEGYIDELRDTFDTECQRIYIDGLTGNLGAGAVYYQFTQARNVSDHATYDPGLPIHITFDFNVAFMYAAIFQEQKRTRQQEAANGPITTHCVDEIGIKSSGSEDVCRVFLERYRRHTAGVRVYGDPSGMHRDTRNEQNDYDVIRRTIGSMHNFALLVNKNDAAKKEFRIRNRAVSVNNLLEKGLIVINPECKHLIRSISETRWDPNKEGLWKKRKVADPNSDEFVVDHPMDAADYYFAKRFPYTPSQMTFR